MDAMRQYPMTALEAEIAAELAAAEAEYARLTQHLDEVDAFAAFIARFPEEFDDAGEPTAAS